MVATALPSAAREAMERLNGEAEGLYIWLRTQANAPAQRSWFEDSGIEAGVVGLSGELLCLAEQRKRGGRDSE